MPPVGMRPRDTNETSGARTVSGLLASLNPVSAANTTPSWCWSTWTEIAAASRIPTTPWRLPAGVILRSLPATSSYLYPSSGMWSSSSAVIARVSCAIDHPSPRAFYIVNAKGMPS